LCINIGRNTNVIRNSRGFSLALSIFIGILLTGVSLAMMVRSSSEVQVALGHNTSANALNAAESAGTTTIQAILDRGNGIAIPDGASNTLISHLCKSNPVWVLVEQGGGTYRSISTISGATPIYLDKNGGVVNRDSDAFDPVLLSAALDPVTRVPYETITGNAVIKESAPLVLDDDDGNVTTTAKTANSTLGLTGLAANPGCTSATSNPLTKDADGNITAVSFLPGATGKPGLTWTGSEVDPATGDIIITNRKVGKAGSNNEVWGQARLKNFRLNVVEVIANPSTHKPSGAFRLVYTFDALAEGQIRTPSGKVIGRQIIQAPDILVVEVKQNSLANTNFSQYSFFIDDSDVCYGTNQTITGKAHVNRGICFFAPNSGEKKIEFTGEFTTAQCQFSAGSCPYGTVGRPEAANFSGGAKFKEDGIGYIEKPSNGNYQIKAALFGQLDPSTNPQDDLLKNSEIRTQIGINSSSASASAPPPAGVYWVNPTDKAASNTDPAAYSDWLTKATTNKATNPNNAESNLLSGIYIQGDVDYVNLYAAQSSGASDPNLQIVEIQQTTAGNTRKTRFTLDKSADTTKVEVASASGAYGSPIVYNKSLNGVIFIDGNVGDNTKACPPSSKSSCRGVISIPGNDLPAGITAPANLSVGPPSNPNSVKDTPSVQKDWGLTLAVNGDVAIQDNLNYQVDPRGADRQFGTNPDTGVDDDPSSAEAKNALGILAFDQRQYKKEDGTAASPINVEGTIYWGQGLKDNVRLGRDPADSTDVDVVDIQASLYGYSETLNYDNSRLAEYIQVLGGEIMTKAKGDYSFGCNSSVTPPGGKPFTSSFCSGSKVKIIGDKRFSDGTVAPPGFPKAKTSAAIPTYSASAVGKQSIGKIRWQTLTYQPN
jgi:hypothetical protein